MKSIVKPKLYYRWDSAPCCTVLAVARMLGINFDLKLIDPTEMQQKFDSELRNLNPFNEVPTLVEENGDSGDRFTLWESHVIVTYLIETRHPDSSLYPVNDVKKRAIIDRWLQYDAGTYYRTVVEIINQFGPTETMISDSGKNRLNNVLKALDQALNSLRISGQYLAGSQVTVADVSMYFTTAIIEVIPEIDLTSYHHLYQWYQMIGEAMKQYDQDGKFRQAIKNLVNLSGDDETSI